MDDEIKLGGKWTINNNFETEYEGELYINDKKGIIRLIIHHYPHKNPLSYNYDLLSEITIITGVLVNGAIVTLYKCTRIKQHTQLNTGHNTYIYDIKYAFDGIMLKGEDEVVFLETQFELTHLPEWASMNGIEEFCVKDAIYSIAYKPPEEVEFLLENDTKILIVPSFKELPTEWTKKEITIQQGARVHIKFSQEKPLLEHLKTIRVLMGMISLGIGLNCEILSIDAIHKDKYFSIESNTGDLKRYLPIKVYFNESKERDYPATHFFNHLFSLPVLKKDIQLYISNWFSKSEILSPIVELYLSTLKYNEMSLERIFLCLVQALESYHRRIMINFDIEPDEHTKRIKSIISSCPREHKDWLKQRLAFSNEPTLQQRLTELFKADDEIWFYFHSGDEQLEFIKNVKNTRNYHTHYDLRLKDKSLKNKELEEACCILRVVLEYYLLKEIGLHFEYIQTKIKEKEQNIRFAFHPYNIRMT